MTTVMMNRGRRRREGNGVLEGIRLPTEPDRQKKGI